MLFINIDVQKMHLKHLSCERIIKGVLNPTYISFERVQKIQKKRLTAKCSQKCWNKNQKNKLSYE